MIHKDPGSRSALPVHKQHIRTSQIGDPRNLIGVAAFDHETLNAARSANNDMAIAREILFEDRYVVAAVGLI